MRQTTTPLPLPTSPDQLNMFGEAATPSLADVPERASTSTAVEFRASMPRDSACQNSTIRVPPSVASNVPGAAASPSATTPSDARELDLDPSQIRMGAFAGCTISDDQADTALADDLRSRGQLSPVTVRPLADGVFELVDGHRRVRAHAAVRADGDASGACRPTIRAIVRQVTPLDAAIARLAESDHQRHLCALDRALAVGYVYTLARADNPALTTREFAALLNRALGATSEQIRITEHVTRELLGAAGLVRDDGTIDSVVRLLSHRTLLEAVKHVESGETAHAAALLRTACAPAAAHGAASPTRPVEPVTVTRASNAEGQSMSAPRLTGRPAHVVSSNVPFSLRLSKPIAELPADAARAHAVTMISACAALIRAGTDSAVAYIETPTGEALVLADTLDALDRESCARLIATLDDLRRTVERRLHHLGTNVAA